MSIPINLISLKTCFFLAFSSRFIQIAFDPYSIGVTDVVIISCLVYAFYYKHNTFNEPPPPNDQQIANAISMLTQKLGDILEEAEKKEKEIEIQIENMKNKDMIYKEEECGDNITKELDDEFKDLTWFTGDIAPCDPDT